MIRALTDRISQVEEDDVEPGIDYKVNEVQEDSTKNKNPNPALINENKRNFHLAFEPHGAGQENLKDLGKIGYSMGSRNGFTPDDIEDITSASMRKMIEYGLLRYRPRINPENLTDKDFKAYFCKFFFNAMNDLARRKRVRSKGLDYSEPNGYLGCFNSFMEKARSSGSPSPEYIVIQSEEQTLLRELINELPPIYQDILLRRYLNQQSCKEVSAALNIPEGTVKSRLHDARSKLKEKVEKEASSIIPLNGNYRS